AKKPANSHSKSKAKPRDPRQQAEAVAFAIAAARCCQENHCEEILVLDLRGVSPITDYFVIATGTSGRQMRAVAEQIKELGKKQGHKLWQMAGTDSAEWIVQDFVDTVIHLFDSDHRHYYDLELIWGDAPRIDWIDGQASDETS
ncbi:MAG: ribosome silencing factor, partial [Planctomycetota bacterium]